MSSPIDQYLADQFGHLNVPEYPKAQIVMIMARALLGSALTHTLDYWIAIALDKIDNLQPAKPYIRDNDLSRRDRYFRDAFSKIGYRLKRRRSEAHL